MLKQQGTVCENVRAHTNYMTLYSPFWEEISSLFPSVSRQTMSSYFYHYLIFIFLKKIPADQMQFRSNAARKRHQRRTHFAMSFVMIFALIGLYATNSNGTEKFDDSPLQREDSYGVSKQESLVGGNSIDEDGVGVAPPSREDTTQQAESGYDINEDELGKVKQISLLGERNSGTNWMTDELKQCFPNLTVKPRLVRWKHWFQHDDGKEHNTTLVVAQFRNPYDWIAAMQKVTHHSPLHIRLHWNEFVTVS